MKINKGDTLEEISLPKPDGSIFNLSEIISLINYIPPGPAESLPI